MRFDIVTLFPGLFRGIFEHGVLRRALEGGLLHVQLHDLRSFTHDRHRTVDDRPFGGGEGMVLKPEPIAEAVASLNLAARDDRRAQRQSVILLSAQGRKFTQATARALRELDRVVLICGRYEGVDERVSRLIADEELCIGDYVLSGGELAAAVVVDATMRLLPDVLGNAASTEFESFGALSDAPPDLGGEREAGAAPRSTHGAGGLLDYPHYTRPVEFLGVPAPGVLLSGNHAEIRRWRRRMALEKTLRNRPDLLETAVLTAEDRRILESLSSRPESSGPAPAQERRERGTKDSDSV
jgi:tRNA (guanine37-N1)-methyltransferase